MKSNKAYLLANEISKRIFEKQNFVNSKLSKAEMELIAYECAEEWQAKSELEPYNYNAMKKLIETSPILEYHYEMNHKDFTTDDKCFKKMHSSLIGPYYEAYNELYRNKLDLENGEELDEELELL